MVLSAQSLSSWVPPSTEPRPRHRSGAAWPPPAPDTPYAGSHAATPPAGEPASRTVPAPGSSAPTPGAPTPGTGAVSTAGAASGAVSVSVRALTRSFPVPGRHERVVALAGVDLDLAPGSFTAVVGASGCGKSTLLTCVAGLDHPTSGSVRLLGRETTALRPGALASFRAAHVGMVFQEDNLVTCLNARDNVALPGRLRGRRLRRGQVDAALARVGLAGQARHMPSQMSGGERQRVAIARVLAARPQIVLADEPTAALDLAASQDVLEWFDQIAAEGATLLMVTHDPAAAARADRVLVMAAGRVVEELAGGAPTAVSAAVLRAQGRKPVDAATPAPGNPRPTSEPGPDAVAPGAAPRGPEPGDALTTGRASSAVAPRRETPDALTTGRADS